MVEDYLVSVLLTTAAIIQVLWDWVSMRKLSLEVLADSKLLNLRCCAECTRVLMQYWKKNKGGITDQAGGTVTPILALTNIGNHNSPFLIPNVSDTFTVGRLH